MAINGIFVGVGKGGFSPIGVLIDLLMMTSMAQADNLYCVILAGGVGRRFWPYSRRSYPKQFLDFFNSGRSLLQTTAKRFQKILPIERILVSTNESYRDIVREQLPDLPEENILCEPNSRNTACAIATVAKHIYARNPEAIVAITPSDHLVTDEAVFCERVKQAWCYAVQHSMIVTIGIKPTYPEEGYGYIQAETDQTLDYVLEEGSCHIVKTFIEKPNAEMARVLVDSGEFYWNAGIFVAKSEVIIEEVEEHAKEIAERLYSKPEVWNTPEEYHFVQETLPYCPNISFDYAVMEKSHRVVMITADMGWTDVGTWSSAYRLTQKDDNANASVGEHKHIFNDSQGNLVVMDNPDKLVVLQGIRDLLVVEQDDVLLVCRRGEESKLRQVVPEAQSLGDHYID